MKPEGALTHKSSADLSGHWFCRGFELICLEAEKDKLSWDRVYGEITISKDGALIKAINLATAHNLELLFDDDFKADEWMISKYFFGGDFKEIRFWSPGA